MKTLIVKTIRWRAIEEQVGEHELEIESDTDLRDLLLELGLGDIWMFRRGDGRYLFPETRLHDVLEDGEVLHLYLPGSRPATPVHAIKHRFVAVRTVDLC